LDKPYHKLNNGSDQTEAGHFISPFRVPSHNWLQIDCHSIISGVIDRAVDADVNMAPAIKPTIPATSTLL
jgi:hypothetical protein